MSESASDVGSSTFLVILESGTDAKFVSSPRIDEIRVIWNKSGAPRVPKAALNAIPDMMFSVADLAAIRLNDADTDGYTKIFGKTGRLTRDRMMKEYMALVRSTGYSTKRNG